MSGQKSGGGFVLALLMSMVGLTLAIGPMFLGNYVPNFSTTSQIMLQSFGGVILLFSGILLVITKLYHKTSADEAFVRSGMGGRKCIINGGAIVIPVIHDVVPVSLRTTRLDVTRIGADALLTSGGLRADVKAEFYIKVQAQPDDVLAAATSLGASTREPERVKDLVEHKLVSALRTVAAIQTLEELNAKRDEFAAKVKAIVQEDLQPNGLTLESVTVSALDQTNPASMKPDDNVFDAMGMRTIAEKTNAMRVKRNEVKLEADKLVKEKTVETEKFIYLQEVTRTKAEADADAQKKMAKAEAEQAAATKAAEQARLAGVAQADADKGIQVAKVEQQRAIDVANQQREQATKEAEITRQKATQLADREREVAIADAEKRRADAQAQLLAAEKLKAEAEQAVQTVNITAQAEREKSKTVITQQAEIEKNRLTDMMKADVAAYTQIKQAEGEQEAATRKADARIKLAQADKSAKVLEAEGDQAIQMVPVTVDRSKVDVEKARVAVQRDELENKAQFSVIARDLEIKLAEIEANKQAEIGRAHALGEALAKANLTMYGTNETLQSVMGAFNKGQGYAQLANGLAAGLSDEAKAAVIAALGGIGSAGASLFEKVTGASTTPAVPAPATHARAEPAVTGSGK